MILQRLNHSGGATLKDLEEEFGVSYRTIQRDIEALGAIFPVVDEQGSDGQKIWKLMDTYKDRIHVPFTLSEMVSLYLALDYLGNYPYSPYYRCIRDLCQKISSEIQGDHTGSFSEISRLFYSHHKPVQLPKKMEELFDQVTTAVIEHRTLVMNYLSRTEGKPKKYTIDPYLIMPHEGKFFLHAYVHEYQEERTFAMDNRMKHIELSGAIFLPPDAKKLQARIDTAFGIINEDPVEVKIRFAAAVEKRLRSQQVHGSQKLEKLPNGDILLTLNAGGKAEIIWWVLSYGALAEILEPEDMRREITQTLKNSLANYSSVTP
jgi:predicted DNA-binding transcriptional regulator YafY